MSAKSVSADRTRLLAALAVVAGSLYMSAKLLGAPLEPSQNTPGAVSDRQPVDVVLTNGKIYTEDSFRQTVEALAVRGGKIIFTGNVPPTFGASLRPVPYLQPIFEKDAGGNLSVKGPVDVNSPVCVYIRAKPAEYSTPDQISDFMETYGYHPGHAPSHTEFRRTHRRYSMNISSERTCRAIPFTFTPSAKQPFVSRSTPSKRRANQTAFLRNPTRWLMSSSRRLRTSTAWAATTCSSPLRIAGCTQNPRDAA